MQLVREVFAQWKKIIGVTAQDDTASTITDDLKGESVTVICMSGNLWINPITTAVADATAFKLVAGMTAPLNVESSLSLISDATGATYQIIVHKP